MRSRTGGDGLAVVTIVLGGLTGATVFSDLVPAGTGFDVARAAPAHSVAAAPAGSSVAFYASSLDGWWTVTGDYAGTIRRDASGLVLDAPQARIRFNTREDPAPPVLRSIRLALAEETELGWHVVLDGDRHAMAMSVEPGVDRWVEDLRLRLPDVSDGELEGRWWVIVHELENADGSVAETYAHADPALMDRFMARDPRTH